eukprot:Colp12_sorted_trinity150504_noHs@16291
MPKRVAAPFGDFKILDYVFADETLQDSTKRLKDLLGMDVDVLSLEELEQVPSAPISQSEQAQGAMPTSSTVTVTKPAGGFSPVVLAAACLSVLLTILVGLF